MMARNLLLTGLAVILLTTLAVTACARVPGLIDEVRWGPIHEEPQPGEDVFKRRSITIAPLPAAPELDGFVDDDVWKHAAKVDTWMVNTGEGLAPVQTTAWLGIHDDRLYVAVRAEEPKIDDIVADVTEDGGDVWTDDCIEMFIDSNLDLRTARQLVINSNGSVVTLSRGEDWSPTVARAARVGQDAWFVEFALPIADLGLTASQFGLNLCRERRANEELQLFAWSPTGDSFLEPSRFGIATLADSWLRAGVMDQAVVGYNDLTVTLNNPTEQERALRVKLNWRQGQQTPLERVSGPFTLAPGDTREVTVNYHVRRSGLPVEIALEVLDESGDIVAERHASQSVVDALSMQVSRRLLPEGHREMTVRGTLQLAQDYLERTRVILAVFDDQMILKAREAIEPVDRVMRADLQLPPLEAGRYSLHLVLKDGDSADAQRIAEDRLILEVLPQLE